MTVRPFWRQRPLVCLAAFFGVGLWLGKTTALPPWIYTVGLFGSAAVLARTLRAKRSTLAAEFSAEFFLAGLYMNLLWNRPLPPEGSYTIRGVVSGDVEIDGARLRACLRQADATDGDGGVQALGQVYWTWDLNEEEAETAASLFDGDRVTFDGKVYRPSGRQNPHGLDFRLYLREKGMLVGVTGGDGLQAEKEYAVGLSGWTYRLRRALCSRMDAVFGEDAAYPKALLLGERQYLSPETVTAFRDLGIAHILAVSGLHVGLLAGLLMGAASLLGVPLRARVAALCAFLLAYCALLDFSPPVVRASLLLTGAWVRRTVRRSEDGLTLLAAAFLMILLARPFALFSLSFQLTFAAVLGLILLSEPAERLLNRLHFRRLARPFAATVSASAAVAVPVANAFHQLSLMGLLVNPLACFAAGLILPAYVAVFAAGCVYLPAGQALAAGLRFCVGWLPAAMDRAASLPFATVRVPSVSMWLAAALAVCLLLCTRYVVLAPRRRLAVGAAVLAAGVLMWQGTLCRDVRYVQLAAGQADCAVLEDGRSTVVIDAGENGGDLLRYLAAEGRRVDTLVLTHLHSDHAGGVRQLLEAKWPVDRVVLPARAMEQAIDPGMAEMLDALRDEGARIEEAVAGDEIVTERCRIRFVWPYAPRPGQNANWYCLAALCEMDGVTLLTLSDLPGDYEMYAAAPADILKAAHHGSNSGTGRALLENVSPQAVLLTCGQGGQLPGQETLERLTAFPAALFRTDETGAVTVRVRQGAYQIECFLRR